MANEIQFVPALILALVMIFLGTFVRYRKNKKESTKSPFVDQLAGGVLAGMTIFFYGLGNGWSYPYIIACCGAGGLIGPAIIRRVVPPELMPKDGDDNEKT
ncbi:TPA: hypothetical protein ROF77_002141 [Enterobacter asburiae]|nr:hypothetical protein [Enterobacter asburiae]